MNLTQTKRWSEFEIWYNNAYFAEVHNRGLYFVALKDTGCNESNFIELPFEFQEGVYRKFIESLVDGDNEKLYLIEMENFPRTFILNSSRYIGGFTKTFNTFQELVTWFFNEV